jgi:hypothetical protein
MQALFCTAGAKRVNDFEFERVVKGWRGIHAVLDLRLKK